MFRWVVALKKKVSCLSLFQMLSNPQSYLITTGWTDNVLWNWFTVVFLDFTNLKANFLHYRNEYITGFTYHLHLAKLLRKEHHATFRCKPLTFFSSPHGDYNMRRANLRRREEGPVYNSECSYRPIILENGKQYLCASFEVREPFHGSV